MQGQWLGRGSQLRLTRCSARPLQDFGFDFSVPDTQTPGQPGSSTRKRKTPQSASVPSTQAAHRRTRSSTGSDAAEAPYQAEAGSAQNKRRRLSSNSPAQAEQEDVSLNAEPLADIAEEEPESESEAQTQENNEPAQVEVTRQSGTFLETPQSVRKRRVIQYTNASRSGSGRRQSSSVQPLGITPNRNNISQPSQTPQTSSSGKKRKKRKSIGQKPKGSSKRRSLLAEIVSPGEALSSKVDAATNHPAPAPQGQLNGSEEGVQALDLAPNEKKPLRRRLLHAIQRLTGRRSSTPVLSESTTSAKRKRGRPRKASTSNPKHHAEVEDRSIQRVDQSLSEVQEEQTAEERSAAIGSDEGDTDVEADEIAAVQAKRARRKRRSVTTAEDQAEDESEAVDAESADEIAPTPKRGRPRKSLARAVEEERHGDGAEIGEDVEVVTSVKKRGRPRESDVQSAAPKSARQKQERQQHVSLSGAEPSSSTGAVQASETSADAPKAISVGVYRMTGAEHLKLDTDGQSDNDDLTAIPKRSGVNAVDVLSQICGEQIEKHLMRIRTHAKREKDKKRRRELQDARQLISQFVNDLETRLLEMVSDGNGFYLQIYWHGYRLT